MTECASRDPAAVAAQLDRDGKTSAYSWLLAHDPSSLDVAGADPQRLRPLIPDATVRRVPSDVRRACAAAHADRALLFVLVSRSNVSRRDAAEDCGFAVHRDDAALVIAPR